jgi:hypothetical protein
MAVVTGLSTLTGGFNQVVSSGLVQAQNLSAAVSLITQYTNGTGAGQIDLLYAKRLTVVASTPQTLDLNALPTIDGATSAFVRVREFWAKLITATVDFNAIFGAAAANPWAAAWGTTGLHTLMAGTILAFSDPVTVGASKGYIVSGTSKNLKIDPGSNVIVLDLLIAGCSAAS